MASIDDKFRLELDLLVLRKDEVKKLLPVTTSLIFDKNGNEFNTKGLFSNEIFGPIGSEERYDKISYINLKTPILHPAAFDILIGYNSLYTDIINGKRYAKFNSKSKKFEEVDMSEESNRTRK